MNVRAVSGIILLLATSGFEAEAASIYAGEVRAAAVCAHCHGVRTPSQDAPFPPLAGRDREYLEQALRHYRDKTRKSDIMNAIAGSLSDDDIANVAAYYARQTAQP
jgi:cytochrome c553